MATPSRRLHDAAPLGLFREMAEERAAARIQDDAVAVLRREKFRATPNRTQETRTRAELQLRATPMISSRPVSRAELQLPPLPIRTPPHSRAQSLDECLDVRLHAGRIDQIEMACCPLALFDPSSYRSPEGRRRRGCGAEAREPVAEHRRILENAAGGRQPLLGGGAIPVDEGRQLAPRRTAPRSPTPKERAAARRRGRKVGDDAGRRSRRG